MQWSNKPNNQSSNSPNAMLNGNFFHCNYLHRLLQTTIEKSNSNKRKEEEEEEEESNKTQNETTLVNGRLIIRERKRIKVQQNKFKNNDVILFLLNIANFSPIPLKNKFTNVKTQGKEEEEEEEEEEEINLTIGNSENEDLDE
ncbi:hypothetical protein BLOT_014692 [Blomia tropicalis]|nr:hypothetical protein BLOT_014692 [Blomia tropicalis]